MKVIILAGGWGTRLGQMTELLPKPMVTIGTKPVLWHIMKIYSHFGFNDFIIATGVKGHVIKEYFYNFESANNDFTINLSNGDVSYHNKHREIDWKVTLVNTGLNTLKGGRIKRLEKYLLDDVNMLTYGDGVADVNIQKLVQFHKQHRKMVTITGVRPPSRFGEIKESNGRVISFEEKPQTSNGLINGGFMIFNKKLMDYLTIDENCDFEFGIFDELSKRKELMVYKHGGQWECMDHARDVVHLNHLWNTRQAFWKVW